MIDVGLALGYRSPYLAVSFALKALGVSALNMVFAAAFKVCVLTENTILELLALRVRMHNEG